MIMGDDEKDKYFESSESSDSEYEDMVHKNQEFKQFS